MANEIRATGVVFSIGDADDPEVFTVVPGIQGIPQFPAEVPPDIDVTALDSPAEEIILGLGQVGEFNFTLNLRKNATNDGWLAAQELLESYAGDDILRGCKLEVMAGASVLKTYTWQGFVKMFRGAAASANSQVTAEVMIRNSGAITVA